MNAQSNASKTGKWAGRLSLPLLLFAFFSPLLTTGLFQDDIVLAVMNFHQPDTLASIAGSVEEWISGWIEIGRFFPVSTILSVSMFHWFDFTNPIGYHVLQVLLISASCYVFAMCFFEDQARRLAAILLFCAMSATYWSYHDPYVSYHLVMPVFTLLFLGSVAMFERHLKTGSLMHGLAALTLYLLALATYEIAYPLILVFIIQILRTRPKCVAIWVSLAILMALMFVFQGWLRMQARDIEYEGISVGLSPFVVTRTFLLQVFACFPLAPQVGGVIRKFIEQTGSGVLDMLLVGAGLFALASLSVYLLLRFFKNRSKENSLLLIGLIIWLSPALVISISAKYQAELVWGLGYLPRYLQSFGLVLVIIGLTGKLITTRAGLSMLCMLALLVFALNVRTIRKLNRDFAAAKLLFSVVEDRTFLEHLGCERLFITTRYLHSCEQFKDLNAELNVHDGESPKQGDHVLLIHPGNPGFEWAVLGKYENGLVHEPTLLLGKRHPTPYPEGGPASFRQWTIFPLDVTVIDYQSLLDSVSSGNLPLRQPPFEP